MNEYLKKSYEAALRENCALAARLAVAEAYIEALEQNLNDFVDLKTMDEAIAWRATTQETVTP